MKYVKQGAGSISQDREKTCEAMSAQEISMREFLPKPKQRRSTMSDQILKH
jgi:hypothetical protein